MIRRFSFMLAGCLMLASAPCFAELVVITSSSTGIDRLSRDEVVNVFFGRLRQFSNGHAAIPLDLAGTEKAAFYQQLVQKDLAEISSYWARLSFTGRTQPPRQAENPEILLDLVRRTPGAIAYIDRSRVDSRLKIIFELAP